MSLSQKANHLHILPAIVWLGGRFTVVFPGAVTAPRGERDNLVQTVRYTEFFKNGSSCPRPPRS